jgi:hypothetical protein
MNTELLNHVANYLGTTDKNVVISVAIKFLVSEGMTLRRAYDKVLGEGQFEKLARAALKRAN